MRPNVCTNELKLDHRMRLRNYNLKLECRASAEEITEHGWARVYTSLTDTGRIIYEKSFVVLRTPWSVLSMMLKLCIYRVYNSIWNRLNLHDFSMETATRTFVYTLFVILLNIPCFINHRFQNINIGTWRSKYLGIVSCPCKNVNFITTGITSTNVYYHVSTKP